MLEASANAQLSRTVLVRIRSVLPALRPSERAVAELVLSDPSRAATMSIGDLAEECGTSTTSVVRFYKKVGYGGYSDLRLDLARETARESVAHGVPAEVYEDINTADSLQDIVSKIAFNETMSIADTARCWMSNSWLEPLTWWPAPGRSTSSAWEREDWWVRTCSKSCIGLAWSPSSGQKCMPPSPQRYCSTPNVSPLPSRTQARPTTLSIT